MSKLEKIIMGLLVVILIVALYGILQTTVCHQCPPVSDLYNFIRSI